MAKIGRNAPCPCGSGRKYKKCCLKTEPSANDKVTNPIRGDAPGYTDGTGSTDGSAVAPKLILRTDSGDVSLDADCIVVFIDETGQENFKDPQYPVFGLGGCAVRVDLFERLIHRPWSHMKDRWFDGDSLPLHAADLREPSQQQLEALAYFFTNFGFCRVAAMVSDQSELLTDLPPYQLAAEALIQRILHVAKWQRFTNVALIFEATARGDRLAHRYFSRFEGFDVVGESGLLHAPISKYFAPKSCISGMEVADFIMHAAGGAVRTWGRTKERRRRRDFEAVFHNVDKNLISYINIEKVTEHAHDSEATDEEPSDAGRER